MMVRVVMHGRGAGTAEPHRFPVEARHDARKCLRPVPAVHPSRTAFRLMGSRPHRNDATDAGGRALPAAPIVSGEGPP